LAAQSRGLKKNKNKNPVKIEEIGFLIQC